jgi:acyl carrier protein
VTTDEALVAVRGLVAELHGPAGDAEPLGLESLTVVLLVEALEDRHGVTIPVREVTPEAFATIGALAALVARVAG